MEAEAFNATASFVLQKTGEEKEMNYNERKFNMDIAAVCGLREAVIVDFITMKQHTDTDISGSNAPRKQ